MHTMENTTAFFKGLEAQYGVEGGRVMQAIAAVKAEADLHDGKLNTGDVALLGVLGFLMEAAAKSVGLDKDNVIETLKGTSAALNSDLEKIAALVAKTQAPVVEAKEEPAIPSPELTSYLARLAGETRH